MQANCFLLMLGFKDWCEKTINLEKTERDGKMERKNSKEDYLNCCFLCCCSSLSHVRPTLYDPWAAAHQASLSSTISQSLLDGLMSIESVMPSNCLVLCHPLLLLPSVFPSISVFSNESALCIGWPNYWNFAFFICPKI